MSIGVEVFALAQSPLIDEYPTLKTLVLSFKSQFSELGIDPRMVRRATDLHAHSEKGDDAPDAGEAQLRAWLGDWLASIPTRQSRGAEWLLSAPQIRDLLGQDLYPHPATAGQETGPRPTQDHLDRMTDILGAHILSAMRQIWTSPHTRLFANPLVADVEDFAAYAADVARLEAGRGARAVAVGLESVFPRARARRAAPRGYEEQLLALEAQSRRRWARAAAERKRVMEGGGAAGGGGD